MSSQASRRATSARVASPRKSAGPKPILKRPAPLKLSPEPYRTTVTIVLSPALTPAVSSPHVQFAASPVLTAVFSTHSPNSYDRSSTVVVPNPLELPGWGQRVYSPGQDAFSAVKSPAVDVPLLLVNAPPLAVPSEKDTDVNEGMKEKKKMEKGKARVKGSPRPRELGKALTVYPRSPYPTAPTTPTARDKENSPTAAAGVARAKSLDSPKSKGLSKRAARRPASLKVPAPRVSTPRVSSPLANGTSIKFLSPVVEAEATATIASTRLSQEFWQSVSLEDVDADGEYVKLSALEHEEGSTPISAIPHFVFGTKDGLMWSPGLPPKDPVLVMAADIRSPADQTGCEFIKPSLEEAGVFSPKGHQLTPYPMIETVLSADEGAEIAYPPPVLHKEALV